MPPPGADLIAFILPSGFLLDCDIVANPEPAPNRPPGTTPAVMKGCLPMNLPGPLTPCQMFLPARLAIRGAEPAAPLIA